eukprot:2431665-Prymnesium_polylepis.1
MLIARVNELMQEHQKTEYFLALELRHAQGWESLGPTHSTPWFPSSSTRTQAENRESRRQVRAAPANRDRPPPR